MRISFVVLFCVFLSCSLPPADYSSPEGDEVGIAIIAPCEIFTGEHAEAKVVCILTDGRRREIGAEVSSSTPEILAVNGADVEALFSGCGMLAARWENYEAVVSIRVMDKPDFSRIKIYRLMYNPAGSDAGGEYICIKNTGDFPVNLSGVSLRSKNILCEFTSFVLAAGETCAAVQDEAKFPFADTSPVAAFFSAALRNSGETVVLLCPDGSVDEVYVQGGSAEARAPSSWGSASAPDAAEGKFIERVSGMDTDTYLDWKEI